MKLSVLGTSRVEVPPLCFGTTTLGSMPMTYGYEVDEERARATIHAILDGPAKFIDTSRNYGSGRSEARIGAVIRERGGLPPDAVISTKLDRDMETRRLDADQARRSIEESLEALHLNSVDILHLHDPEYAADLGSVIREGGALDALFKMKEEGICKAVGLAAGPIDLMMPIIQDWPFDALITHNRFTLVNRNAVPMLDLADSRGIAILNAAPYNGGIFAKGSDEHDLFVYQKTNPDTIGPVQRIETICEESGIPTGALALQFSMKDPRVTSTICGVSRPERVRQTLEWANYTIPNEVWARVDALPFRTDDPEASRVYEPD